MQQRSNSELIRATYKGDINAVKHALNARPRPTVAVNDIRYMTFTGSAVDQALYAAASEGRMPIIQLLLKHGAVGFLGALREALIYGHTEIAELMITKGANDWACEVQPCGMRASLL